MDFFELIDSETWLIAQLLLDITWGWAPIKQEEN